MYFFIFSCIPASSLCSLSRFERSFARESVGVNFIPRQSLHSVQGLLSCILDVTTQPNPLMQLKMIWNLVLSLNYINIFSLYTLNFINLIISPCTYSETHQYVFSYTTKLINVFFQCTPSIESRDNPIRFMLS